MKHLWINVVQRSYLVLHHHVSRLDKLKGYNFWAQWAFAETEKKMNRNAAFYQEQIGKKRLLHGYLSHFSSKLQGKAKENSVKKLFWNIFLLFKCHNIEINQNRDMISYLDKIINLDPRCSLSFFRASVTSSFVLKVAMASPEGLPSRFKITLIETHSVSGRKKSFISFSVALKGSPDILRHLVRSCPSELSWALPKVARALSKDKLIYLKLQGMTHSWIKFVFKAQKRSMF